MNNHCFSLKHLTTLTFKFQTRIKQNCPEPINVSYIFSKVSKKKNIYISSISIKVWFYSIFKPELFIFY